MRHPRSLVAVVVALSAGCLAGQPLTPVAYAQCETTVVVEPTAPVSSSAPLEVASSPFGSSRAVAGQLRGDIFAIPENTRQLPDFRTLRPLGSVYTPVVDVAPRHFDQGFPGVSDRFEWFAVRYEGSFRINTAGPYRFRILADDGARLLLDGQPVVTNDGVHGPAWSEGSVVLPAGQHSLVLEYFQGPRFEIALQLFWSPPGQPESLFRADA